MINYSQNILGKNLQELTIDDVQNYFVEQRLETDTLEFKSFPAQTDFDALMIKILKTICGFLNGSGGLLILGAPGKTVVGNVDYFQGNLTPVPVQKAVDWFINKISSSITPMPIDISVKIILIEQSYIYLFEVQESKFKPHQFSHIYYIRLDGQTKPAPHYIVQALMRQITYPDLRAAIRLNAFQNNGWATTSKLAIAIFNFSQLQNEENYNYAITLVGGAKFWDGNVFGDDIKILMHNAQLIHKPIKQPLHFGIPYVRTFEITIPNHFDELKIMLSFGGKLSPSKVCIYSLNNHNFNSHNPQANIVIDKENEMFKSKQSIDDSLAFFRNNEVI